MSEDAPVAASPAAAAEATKDPIDRRKSSSSNSDKETEESFEDAPDAVSEAAPVSPTETASVRSLTKRPGSVTKQPSQGKSELDEVFKKVRGRSSLASVPATESDKAKEEADADTEDKDKENAVQEQRKSSVSSSTINRISQATSNGALDNVSLDDDTVPRPKDTVEKSPKEDDFKQSKESKTLSLSSITSALPSMPWSPTADASPSKAAVSPFAPPPAAAAPVAPAPPSRKLTSPFSWLSRNSGQKDKDAPSASSPPQVSPRRNTASSVATLTSNPEMMLSKLEEEKDDDMNGANGMGRNSLKDRFKMIRMREEAGIAALPGEGKEGAEKGVGLGVSTTAEDKDGLAVQQPPLSPLPQSPNTAMTPGTASGVHAGPSSYPAEPVDWDLWQSVMTEGPAAVARTGADELNRAIATGIPSAIRGVIWQVLAQSKNDELEVVYKELVARGTEKDKDRNSNGSASLSSASNLSIAKEPMSSASSVKSEVGSAVNGSASPIEKDSEAVLKAQAAASAERKRKSKEDAAALQKLEKVIRRDLGARTSYSKFAAAQGLQEGLFGVCKAYALFDEGVGYAQGMNFLIMPLLFNMPEEEAFCLLVRLMNQYHLRELFIDGMPGLHMHLYQFDRLLEDFEPALYCHLHRRGISPHLYATQWFLTLFAYRFPLQLVLRIYDLILSEGLSAILRFGIVLMQKNASHLLSLSDMSQLTTYLKDRLFDVYIDAAPSAGSILENGFFGSSSASLDKEVYRADQFVRDACEVKITPELLKAYTTEWEEKTRTERERETELETLRTGNMSLTIKVRRLEERIEAADREQADIATEMVHTQVRNEELKDENESLKGQVRELRNVIEKQPEELEQAWRLERDDLIKRNEKVHEENMKLEKELAELEEQLVQTKMRYAEINTEHETLTRKWTDLKRQFA